jgi:hypothetical protein
MSRTLKTHVSLWGESGELVTLAPGDALPDWADGRVGEHCLAAVAESFAERDDADDTDVDADADAKADGEAEDPDAVTDGNDEESDIPEDAEDPESAPADEVPDFTAAAPRRGRARKQ